MKQLELRNNEIFELESKFNKINNELNYYHEKINEYEYSQNSSKK
jgi:hypothetical protein